MRVRFRLTDNSHGDEPAFAPQGRDYQPLEDHGQTGHLPKKRLPQDGRIMIKYKADGKKKELDFRVSTVPTPLREKVVMRFAGQGKPPLDMTSSGLNLSR